jgi:hypothetical protein
MGAEHWIVRTPSGEEWGIIKRLIIDSTTRQIAYADVILGETGRVVQIPWENFKLQNERIVLGLQEGKVYVGAKDAVSPFGLAETVAKEVWP